MIANAVQRGHVVYVYDESGHQTATLPAGSGSHDGLAGYTGSQVTVRRGAFLYVYNPLGQHKETLLAG